MARLGAHMSIAGGLACAVERAGQVDATALQVFVKSARQWKAKPLGDDEASAFRQAAEESGLAAHTLAHAGYLLNLASPERAARERSLTAFVDELDRCSKLKIPFLVLHPGSHMGAGEEAGLERVVESMDELFASVTGKRSGKPPFPGVTVLLETTAGQGTNLGHRFEHLGFILDRVRRPERLGVCFDTCHVLAAGYEFRDAPSYRATLRELDAAVDLERVRAFHLNDSKHGLASRRDRHEHIGRGEVGLEAFRLILRDRRFRDRPMVLETPKGADLAEDRINLAVLREMLPQEIQEVNVDEFDYELDPERIAQAPLERRDASRLMLLDRESGRVQHRRFTDLVDLLAPEDLLVLNDTRVIRARLIGRKATGGRAEVLLVERAMKDGLHAWHCLGQARRPPAAGATLEFSEGLRGRVLGREGGNWRVAFECDAGDTDALLERIGQVPLPPYIHRDGAPGREDSVRYQTVFAREPGAVAAPTAGLHFSDDLLDALAAREVRTAYLTLHVGPGTFLPVRAERVEDHLLHEESFEIPDALASAVDRTRSRGGRVVAVGTTVVRTLEHRATDDGAVRPGRGHCGLFIYPGFRFRVVDAMITNFHLPRSTLLMLVAAFAGRARTLRAYEQAIAEEYRFYSYGDAMLIRSS